MCGVILYKQEVSALRTGTGRFMVVTKDGTGIFLKRQNKISFSLFFKIYLNVLLLAEIEL